MYGLNASFIQYSGVSRSSWKGGWRIRGHAPPPENYPDFTLSNVTWQSVDWWKWTNYV